MLPGCRVVARGGSYPGVEPLQALLDESYYRSSGNTTIIVVRLRWHVSMMYSIAFFAERPMLATSRSSHFFTLSYRLLNETNDDGDDDA